MPRFLQIPDTIPALNAYATLPASATPAAIAIAELPGLAYWWDPDEEFIPENVNGKRAWKDRRQSVVMVTDTGTNDDNPTLGTAINSEPTLETAGTTLMKANGLAVANASAWSVFFIWKANDDTNRYCIGHEDPITGAAEYGLAVAIQGGETVDGTVRIYRADGTARLQAANAVPLGTAALVGAFYSASEGLTIRVNGAEEANGADTNDLTHTAFQLFQARNLTASAMNAIVGDYLVFDDDYTKAGNATSLAVIEDYLMTKYGL